MSADGPVLLVVRSEPKDPAMLAQYHRWYKDHMKKLLAVDGVLSARRYESVDGDMRFVAIYEIRDMSVFELPAYRAVGKFGDMEPHVRYTRNIYRAIALGGDKE